MSYKRNEQFWLVYSMYWYFIVYKVKWLLIWKGIISCFPSIAIYLQFIVYKYLNVIFIVVNVFHIPTFILETDFGYVKLGSILYFNTDLVASGREMNTNVNTVFSNISERPYYVRCLDILLYTFYISISILYCYIACFVVRCIFYCLSKVGRSYLSRYSICLFKSIVAIKVETIRKSVI